MEGAEENLYVLVKEVIDTVNNTTSISVPGIVTLNTTNNKRPIETIILDDSEECAPQIQLAAPPPAPAPRRPRANLVGKKGKASIEAVEQRKRALEGEAYSSVQDVFNNYPGLFTFFQKGKFESSFDYMVLCKACNFAVHFNNLATHSKLPIHKSYYKPSNYMSYNRPPDVESIMENNKGIFSYIVSRASKQSNDSRDSVYCNPCQKKVSKKHLLRHLAVEEHVQSTIRYMTCEADFTAVADTLTDKTFSIYGNDLFCNPCRVTLPDTLRNIRAHIKGTQHIEAKTKHEVGRILSDFGNVISLKGKNKRQKSLWCNKCEVSIIDGYENVVKHIEGSTHTGRQVPLKERYIGDEEFNQDLAEMFRLNKISFQKIKTMRNFMEKYTNRVMPEPPVLRQHMINEKKKAKGKDDTAENTAKDSTNATNASEDEDDQEMLVYKEVLEEDTEMEGEEWDEFQEVVEEEVVANEEIELEVVQFPAVTESEE